jgi:hypothetical protein
MKTLIMVIPLVFVCCFIFGCQQSEQVAAVDNKAGIQAIKDIVAGINTADNNRYVSFISSG